MKATICLISLGMSLLVGCQTEPVLSGTPQCIKDWITQIKNESVWSPPASIYRYSYQGKTVYYIPQHCCDIPSILMDENCTIICSPDGGIDGGGDGKCADFFAERKNEKLVWQDTRK
ncbi:hypothetical protein WBJ53_24235 [Spirosoma sp. SC4-14]|uniref:DUF6970 domain-containing protein n=1 Tax=Spirosoma sp. SC4-14 TaxID=3128900 RepID=UPI0030D425AA